MPETKNQDAEVAVHKVQEHLSDMVKHNDWPVTFSIGAAVFLPPFESCRRMLSIADAVMYSVKTSGRNALRVELAAATPDKNQEMMEGSDAIHDNNRKLSLSYPTKTRSHKMFYVEHFSLFAGAVH